VTQSRFEPYLSRLVRDWAGAPDEKLREIDGTLVSLDISGFTSLSERLQAKGRAGAEELVLLISGVFEGLIGISNRLAGDVLKFRGDALLILFDGPDHERRACRAATDMQWFIRRTGSTMTSVGSISLGMSCGVYSGACHFFVVNAGHRELLVTGPAATATIRLESDAGSGEILVNETTAKALEAEWLGDARPGGRLLRELEEEGEPSRFDVAAPVVDPGVLESWVPEPLRAQLVLEAGEAEHRQVAAAFVKFSGVDEFLAAEGAESVHAALDELSTLIAQTCADLGVTWLESDIDVDGGKVYLAAGAPSSTGADEERMLRALRTVLDADTRLTIRAGVNRGPAFCGDIGAASRRAYAVMGDTVNLAARLVGRAEPGQLLATVDVLDRSRTRFESEAQPFLMKGKEAAVTAYRVGAITGVREEEPAAAVPLVGREQELAAMTEALNAVRMHQQQVVELVGEPGIGKSRLVDELKTQAIGFMQLTVRCDQYASSSPYAALRELVRPVAGITPDMDAAAAGIHLTTWIGTVMPDLAPWLPLLALPFGAEVEPTPETEEIASEFRRERLLASVEDFLTRVLMMPALVVIEDAHWIDDASREVIRNIVRGPALRPWLICVTRRPQGDDLTHDVQGHHNLRLEPLGVDAARILAAAAAGDSALAADALTLLAERSGGNPLFVRELVAASRDAGDLETLPDRVESVILSRIDTLAPEDRFLLRNASVLGQRFELDLVAEILEPELKGVDDLGRWDRLAEFVAWEGSGALSFVHDLFRGVAYEGLSFKRRREVHARVGEALERRGATVALLAVHFFRAEEYERAWRCAVEAGRDAQRRYANVDALEQYQFALEAAAHLELDSGQVAQVAEALGDVADLAARYDDAESAYARARDLYGGDVEAQARLLGKEGYVRERRGRYHEALDWFRHGIDAVERAGAEGGLVATQIDLEIANAALQYRQGHFEQAIEWAERAAAHALARGERMRMAHAYYIEYVARLFGPGNVSNSRRDEAIAILEEAGELVRLASALNNKGLQAHHEGRWNKAIEWFRRGGETSRRAGDVVNVARAQMNEAEVLSDQGRLEQARSLLEEALRVFRAGGYGIGIAYATAMLGRADARGGNFAESEERLRDALTQLEEMGSEFHASETEAWLAESFVFGGRYREASELLEPLLTNNSAALRSLLERLFGYAIVQSRAPLDDAKPHFDSSLEAARAAGADYEVALTLRAIAEVEHSEAPEADEILERLGVVKTPRVPLP
jgi:class 3 adenylate cyclase/tetratricopeptide (TPR) repeat protein